MTAANHIVVEEQCDALAESCPAACTTPDWTDPPANPPDQNPLKSSLVLTRLDQLLGVQNLKAKGRFNPAAGAPIIAPDSDGIHIRFSDSSGTGYDANVPGGAPGSSACDPRDGWKTKTAGSGATTWTYRNRSGAIPPLCGAASARGLTSIKIKDLRATSKQTIQYSVRAKDTAIAIDTASPLTLVSLDIAMAAEQALGEPSASADAGGCAHNEFSGAPIAPASPAPFCKTVGAPGAIKTVKCKGQ